MVFAAALGGCFEDAPPLAGSTSSIDNTASSGGGDCVEGSAGCPCYGNGSCDAELQCEPQVQVCIPVDCMPGTEGCSCDGGECGAGLECAQGLCGEPVETSSGDTSTTGSPTSSGTTEGDTGSSSSGSREPTVVILFDAPANRFWVPQEERPGNDPRGFLDGLCDEAMPKACRDGVAVISTSTSDDVASLNINYEMPFGLPVLGPAGVEIGPSFAALLDGDLAASLEDAAVTESLWYATATNDDGTFDEDNSCDGFEPADASARMATGAATEADLLWLRTNEQPCSAMFKIVCACWD